MYKILETSKGDKIFDIGSYTGNFLTYYAKKNPNYKYTGIEINHQCKLISDLKLDALKVDHKIIEEDVLKYRLENEYDKVFCNQPFNIKLTELEYREINNTKNKLDIDFSKRFSSDWIFISKVIDSLNKNGKAAILVQNGILYKQPDSAIRKELIEKGYVEAAISLPGNIFYNTAIPTTLLIISNNNKNIKFIDATKMYTSIRHRNYIDVEKIYNEYISDSNTDSSIIINYKNINDNYSLNINNYIDADKISISNPKKLSEVSETIYRGYQVMASESNQYANKKEGSETYKIININNITDGELDKNLNEFYPDNDKYKKYTLQDNDLILSSKGILSKIAVISVGDGINYIPSGNFTIIRTKKDILNPYYLKMFLESTKGAKLIDSIKSGSVAPALSVAMIKEIEVPVPPLEEQEKAIDKYHLKNDEIKVIKAKLRKLEQELSSYTDEEF